MPISKRTAAAASALAVATTAFDPTSDSNVVGYWGQGANQQRLVETCKTNNYDIINVGFVNTFPDQSPGGWPGTNFGNACWGDVYEHDGVNSTLLKTCPYIAQDVQACQTQYNTKVFLSIGGGSPANYYIKDGASGESFADFLWGAFGPVSANDGQPRPWGDVVVDGFDFDIESDISPAPTDVVGDYRTSGYAAMINHLKDDLYPQDTSKSYYISGSPQCIVPDVHFTTVMAEAHFDFLWIQFYNTPQCSARAGVDHLNGEGTSDITFTSWENSPSKNGDIKLYLGLAASETASNDASYYLNPTEAQQLIGEFAQDEKFGGVMLWEATYDMNNTICGSTYSSWINKIVDAASQGKTVDTDVSNGCPTPTSSAVSSAAPTTSDITSATESTPASQASETQYTTFTSLCTENGTTAVHTHSQVVTSSDSASQGPSSLPASGTASFSGNATVSMPVGPTGTGVSSYPLVNATSSMPLTSASPTSYTTFTSLCTENGTTAIHTHSQVVTPSNSTSQGPTSLPASATASFSGNATVSNPVDPTGTASNSSPSFSANATLSAPVEPTSYTTFTSLCTTDGRTEVHTHSQVITPGVSATQNTSVVAPTESTSSISQLPVGTAPASSDYVANPTASGGFSAPYYGNGTSMPVNTQPAVTVTEITSIYTTTCPATSTMTSGSSVVESTYTTVSTVTSTYESTITLSVSPESSSPAVSQPATTVTDVTSVYTTTCPATSAYTSGSSVFESTYTTVSTLTSTYQSTVTLPAAYSPATSQPVTTVTETSSVYTTTCPATATLTSGSSSYESTYTTVSTLTTSYLTTITIPAGQKSSSPSGPLMTTVTEVPSTFTSEYPVTETQTSGDMTKTTVLTQTSTLTNLVSTTITLALDQPSTSNGPATYGAPSTTVIEVPSTYKSEYPVTETQTSGDLTKTTVLTQTSTLTNLVSSTITLGMEQPSTGNGPMPTYGAPLTTVMEVPSTYTSEYPVTETQTSGSLTKTTVLTQTSTLTNLVGSTITLGMDQPSTGNGPVPTYGATPSSMVSAEEPSVPVELTTRYTSSVETVTICPGGCEKPTGPVTTELLTTTLPATDFVTSVTTVTLPVATGSESSPAAAATQTLMSTIVVTPIAETSSAQTTAGAQTPPAYPVGPVGGSNNGTQPGSSASGASASAPSASVSLHLPGSSSSPIAPYTGGAAATGLSSGAVLLAGAVAALML